MLYVGGVGTARGYLAQPGLTAERFIPHPWSDRPGDRLYRTGDLAVLRETEDGPVIEYLGRRDSQVKIRGFRIELGEVEAAVRRVTQARNVAVLVRERDGDRQLVAYIVAEAAAAESAVAVWNDELRQVLPAYMVPSAFVVVDALPLTLNGKLDRVA